MKKPNLKQNAKKSEQDILQQKHSVIGSNNSLTLRNRSLYKNLGSTKANENTAGSNKRIKSKRAQSSDNTNKKKKLEIEDDEENTIDEYLDENDESEIENKMEKKVINKPIKNDASSNNDYNSKAAEPSKVVSTKANYSSFKNSDNSNVNSAIRVEKSIDSIIGKLANKNQNSKESDAFKEKEQLKEKVKEQSKEKEKEQEKEKEKEKQNILEKMPLSKFNLKKSPIKIPIEQKDKIENELKETVNEKPPISTNTTTPTATISNIQNNKINSNEIIKNTNDDSKGLILIDDDEDKNLNENMNAIKESDIKKNIKQIDDAKIQPIFESKENKSTTLLENKDNKHQIFVKSSQSQEISKPCTSSTPRGEDDDDVMVLEDESSTPNRQQITHIQHQNYQLSTSSTSSQAVQFNSFINRQRNSSQSIMYSQNLQTFNQTNIRTMQLPGISSSTALISNQGILMPTNQQNNFYTPNRINHQIINNHQNHLLIVPNFNTINISPNIANIPVSSNTTHNSSLNNQPMFPTPIAQQQTTVSTSNQSNNGSAFKLYNNYTHD
jgi:hypothetical protein